MVADSGVRYNTLLIGFGWFANLRLYERDKAAMGQELEGVVSDGIRRVQEGARSATKEAVEQMVSKHNREVSAQIHRLDAEVRGLQAEFHHAEAVRFRIAGDLGSAVLSLTYAAKIALDLGQDWRLDDILGEIARLLQQAPGMTVGAKTEVADLLQRLPPRYGPIGAQIRDLVVKSASI